MALVSPDSIAAIAVAAGVLVVIVGLLLPIALLRLCAALVDIRRELARVADASELLAGRQVAAVAIARLVAAKPTSSSPAPDERATP